MIVAVIAGRDYTGEATSAHASRSPLVSISTKLAKSRRAILAWMCVLDSAKLANHKRESFVYRCKCERPHTFIPAETFTCFSFESRGSRLKMAALLFMGTLRLMPSGLWRKNNRLFPLASVLKWPWKWEYRMLSTHGKAAENGSGLLCCCIMLTLARFSESRFHCSQFEPPLYKHVCVWATPNGPSRLSVSSVVKAGKL